MQSLALVLAMLPTYAGPHATHVPSLAWGPYPCHYILWFFSKGSGLITKVVLLLMPFSTASGHSKANEDLKQQNSELEEKLRVSVTEKSAVQVGMEELQKKLEMSELLLQQVRGCSPREARPLPAGAWVGAPSQELEGLDPCSGPL